MNEEKRKIGEYTVLCSVNVGEKEVILASNEQSTNGDKYMCGFAERNDLFELCSECMVSDDYIEIVHLFGSRVANEAELFKEQVEKLDGLQSIDRNRAQIHLQSKPAALYADRSYRIFESRLWF